MISTQELATARVERESGPRWTRVLPVAALLFALFLVREAWRERGPRLAVRAADGHGLRPGDALRYRGIEVGKVESLELDGDEVVVGVRLARSARDLARGGARYWIARPVLGVEGVRGLETALGARYLAVLPGARDAPFQEEFLALEEPPLFEGEDPGALEIVLQSSERAGLVRGAPVFYRGIPIGSLASVGLASDATAVEARARIQAPYAELVRVDSRFHRARGASLSLGLGGVDLAVDSLQALWLGGVALATPTHPGARASTGQRFELASEPEEEWLAWRPALPVGGALPGRQARAPERVWAKLSWKSGGWLSRVRSRAGWLVPGGGELLGPADVLVAPEEAAAESAVLELGGERIELADPPLWSAGGLAVRADPRRARARASEPVRRLDAAEDLLLCADPALAPKAVSAAHLAHGEGGWSVAPLLVFDARWHGALALAREDGCWLGILLVEEGRGRIVALPRR
jgi:hypothetical protein